MCVCVPHFLEQWGIPGTAAIRFSFLEWKKALDTYDILRLFVIVALFTNMQAESISKGKQAFLQAPDPHRKQLVQH